MNKDTDRFAFPELPDEAVIALDHFLEALYQQFQDHYFAQLHQYYHGLHEQQHYNDPLPALPLDDPPF